MAFLDHRRHKWFFVVKFLFFLSGMVFAVLAVLGVEVPDPDPTIRGGITGFFFLIVVWLAWA